MKRKFLTVITILCLMLAMTICALAAEAETPKVVQPGDVNADGVINATDSVLLAQYLAGWDVQLGGDSHTVVIDAAVEPTCTGTGLTEGKHCSDCGMILVKQQVVPMADHDYEDTVVPPTETEKGYTHHKCKICEHEFDDSYTGATLAKGLAYEIVDGTCTITGIGSCTETEIHIPETIENCPVTAIADKAFADQTQITKIGLPSTMQTLGQRAFYGCTGLTEFTVPASVTSVGHQVFYKCDNLATVYYNSSFAPAQDKVFLNIPSIKTVVFGGVSVPYQICYNCTNIEKVEILDSVTNFGNRYSNSYAFYGCTNLKEVTIGNSVTSIGSYAFYNCSSLTSVEIPDSVTSIGQQAFYNCSSLTSVDIGNGVTSIGNYAFYGCNSLENLYISDLESWLNVKLNGSSSHPLCFAGGNLYIGGVLATDIEIPDTVTSIGNYTFCGCSSLTSVEIPDSVTSIGQQAFYNCSSLTSVEIPDSVTSIGNYAFSGCSSLTSVEIPDSVTSIGSSAFSNCSSLENLYISDLESWLNVSLSSSSSHPLSSAGGNLYIDGVLATDIEIPDTVASLGYHFYKCDSLTSVVIPDSVTSIGSSAFEGCSSLTSVVIPDSVTSIGNVAFDGCSSLTSVEIGDSVTSIGEYAFYYCSSLTSVEIPDSVTSIGYYAFKGCSSLTSITISDSVTSIGDHAFYKCSSLTTVYYGGSSEDWAAISFGGSVWYDTPSSRKVYYYSATQPTASGNYWRYVDGKPTPW